MAYDGSLIFNTKVDVDGLKKGEISIQQGLKGIKNGFAKLGKSAEEAFSSSKTIDLENKIEVTKAKIDELIDEMDKLAKTEVESKPVTKIVNDIEKAKEKLSELYAKADEIAEPIRENYAPLENNESDLDEMINSVLTQSKEWQKVQSEITATENRLESYKSKLKELKTSGGVIDGADTKAYKEKAIKLQQLMGNLDVYKTKLQEVKSGQKSFSTAVKKSSQNVKELGKTSKSSVNLFNPLEKVIKRIKTALIGMVIYKGLRGIFNSAKEGIQNLVQVSAPLNERLSAIKSSMTQLKNSLATAFAPIITVVTPIITGFINTLSKVVDKLAQFFALLKGDKTYKRAIAVQEDYAKSLDNTTKSAKKQQDTLASFDEINKIGDAEDTESTSGTVSPKDMFEDAEIEATQFEGLISRIKSKLEPVIDKLKKLWNKLYPIIQLISEGLGYIYNYILIPLAKWTITELLPRFLESVAIALEILYTVLKNAWDLFKDFYEKFLKPIANYTGKKFTDFLDKFNNKLQELSDLISESEIWQDLKIVFNEIYKILKPVFEYLIDIAFWFADFKMSNAFINAKYAFKNLEDAIGLVAAIINLDFSDAWEHLRGLLVDNKVDKAREKFELLKNKIIELKNIVETYFIKIKSIMIGVFVKVGEKISSWWNNDVKPYFTIEKWNEILQNMVDSFAEKWNAVYEFFAIALPNWWNENISPWFTLEKWQELMTSAKEGVAQGWNSFVNFFVTELPNWWNEHIAPWFTAERWEELGNGIKSGLVNAFAGAVNGIIDILNWFIGKVNKISFDVPKMLGVTDGFHVGFDFDKIEHWVPKLATGTVVPANYGEFLAVLGDNKREAEVVSPLSTIEQAIRNVLGDNPQGGGDITIPVYIGTDKIDTIIVSAAQRARLAGGGY